MQLDGAALNQDRLKCLDAEAVQGWGTVQKNRAVFNNLFQHFPNLRPVAFNEPAGALNIGGIRARNQA